jgi:hypothetical protein
VAAEVVAEGDPVAVDAGVVEGVLDAEEGGREIVVAVRGEDPEVLIGGRRRRPGRPAGRG